MCIKLGKPGSSAISIHTTSPLTPKLSWSSQGTITQVSCHIMYIETSSMCVELVASPPDNAFDADVGTMHTWQVISMLFYLCCVVIICQDLKYEQKINY